MAFTNGNANTKVAFKTCAPFTRCVTHINDEYVDTARNLDIIMYMYTSIEFCDNYADTSGTLWQFKRDEQIMNDDRNPVDVTAGSTSFRYKSRLLGKPAANGILRNVRIIVPLGYLGNFSRSLDVRFIQS